MDYGTVLSKFSACMTEIGNALRKINGTTKKYKFTEIASAINECTQVYYLGTGTSFDVSNIPDYQNLTKDNFVMDIASISVNAYANVNGSGLGNNGAKPTLAYDANTGKVSITGTTITAGTSFSFNAAYPYGHGYSDHSANGGATVNITPKVYLVKGKIK